VSGDKFYPHVNNNKRQQSNQTRTKYYYGFSTQLSSYLQRHQSWEQSGKYTLNFEFTGMHQNGKLCSTMV